MPIRIPNTLPAAKTLENENIFVMNEMRASHQDIRPLRLILLNLMPTKIVTETQILRLLSNSPLQVDITLLQMMTHVSKNTCQHHLDTFYKSFYEIKDQKFDGMIITGAPVEAMEFEEVDYWDELCDIMRWSKRNVHSNLYICWGALAGLYFNYGIKKHPLTNKISGIYSHKVSRPECELVRGFDEEFFAPHSRYSYIRKEDIEASDKVDLVAESDEAGPLLMVSKSRRCVFITGHLEYDFDTLDGEYKRDLAKGIDIEMPYNYYPFNDPEQKPKNTWRAHAHLLFSNWLNYFVYQETPYDINEIVSEQ